jgi:cob(I)alamin adenosyltransferase
MFDRGLVHIYTGPGKGKTTASIGLAVRAASCNNRVLFYQFLKPPDLDLPERRTLENLDNITVAALSTPWDLTSSLDDPGTRTLTAEAISTALRQLTPSAATRQYDLIILDEIVFCHSENLVSTAKIRDFLEKRDPHVEIVLTGRGASDALIALADYVTEMKNLKHPFGSGIAARKGIEY